jgi:YesN/AraC family two-component response regulator
VKKFVLENEPYLDSSLTIQELAKQVNIPVRDLSVLINHHMNQHFFDFINEFRIQKAMQILKDQSKNKLTVLEILYEVGFNSKSSFNTAFKKHTHKTPTEFRNS